MSTTSERESALMALARECTWIDPDVDPDIARQVRAALGIPLMPYRAALENGAVQ